MKFFEFLVAALTLQVGVFYSTNGSTCVVEGFTSLALPQHGRSQTALHKCISKSKTAFCRSQSGKPTPTSLVLSTVSVQPLSSQPMRIRNWASSLRKDDEVTMWRFAAATGIYMVVASRHAIDTHCLFPLWSYLTASQSLPARIFRTDSYEWSLAVLAFGVYIHFFGYADRAVRTATEQGRTHPWRKYRLQDLYAADKHRRMTQKRNELYNVNDEVPLQTEMPLVKQSPWHWKAWALEFWVYVLPLVAWDILSPRRFRRLAAFGAPTTLKIIRDVAGGLLLYDALFFCGHFIMHKIPFLYNTVHKKHHTTEEVRACDVVRLSVVEEVLEVGFSIIALNALGAHPLARSIYNLIIVFLLTELHCGFDFPWTPQNVVPFGLATGSRRHHYHHRFGQHYYQKFFFTMDRMFGFFQKNESSLKGRAVRSNPFVPASW